MNQRPVGAAVVFSMCFVAAHAHAEISCAELTGLRLPDVRIESAAVVEDPVRHCKVAGTIGRNIGFSVWLPENWNGRLAMGGSGGFVAPEDNQALRFGGNTLAAGYATASTDTGHRADGSDGSWALNDLEAIVNYGHLGMHRAVVASKRVIAEHYGRDAETSFFFGCSNGGRQALHEAQRYPADFDAIVAGAPALDFTGVAAAFTQITEKMFPDPTALEQALLTPADRQLLRAAIEARCDAQDGVVDGILQDPSACDFDPAVLECAAVGADGCLSSEKVAAIRAVYDGPVAAAGPLHVGFPFGAEATDENGWGSWLVGGAASGSPNAAYSFGVGFMRYFLHHDPNWSWVDYDWNSYERRAKPLAQTLNAEETDLSAFRARGGKLLMYHGWADVALSARMSTGYVDSVYTRDPTARADVRLFMMPGVLHCAGGAGPWRVDWINALADWHASGQPPDTLVAEYAGKPGARKLCAWPQQAHYVRGDADVPAAWECR